MNLEETKTLVEFFKEKKSKRYKLLIKYNKAEIDSAINKKEWFKSFIKKHKIENTNLFSFYNSIKKYS